MWLWRNFRFCLHWFSILIFLYRNVSCDPISNHKFNASLTDYFTDEDAVVHNKTEIRTLQNLNKNVYKKPLYSSRLVRFQEAPDNALSSSSHSHGYHHGEYPGSYSYDYDASPYDGGVHGHHDHHHHPHYGHHVDHYHKHHDHALAAKAFLWPLAGLALLGAAATLVTNPVLLQLGVVTGRKRRSANYENSAESAVKLLADNWNSFANSTVTIQEAESTTKRTKVLHNNYNRKSYLKRKPLLTTTSKSSQTTLYVPLKKIHYYDHRYVPVPLMMKNNNY